MANTCYCKHAKQSLFKTLYNAWNRPLLLPKTRFSLAHEILKELKKLCTAAVLYLMFSFCFKNFADGDILLASCAQDCLIRIWKVFAKEENVGDFQDVDAIKLTEDVFEVQTKGETALSAFLYLHLQLCWKWIFTTLHWNWCVMKNNRSLSYSVC